MNGLGNTSDFHKNLHKGMVKMGSEFLFNPEEYEVQENIESNEILEDGIIREIIGIRENSCEELGAVETVFGDPEDAENWHHQSEKYSCAIACQEFVAEQLMDRDFSEQEMIEYAQKKGWYEPTEGTSCSDVGNLLEAIGLDVERAENCTVTDLMQALADGEKVICGVNNLILAEPRLAEMPGLTANHAVEFIGVDFSNPHNPQVILNDPGVKNGQAIRHDMDVFVKSWSTCDNYAVIAGKGVAV